MKRQIAFLILTFFAFSCGNSQNSKSVQLVGGSCEGCEAIFEYGDKKLKAIDTLPDFKEKGQKIKITGTIYQNNGKTPAEGIILYIYHTDQNGLYPNKEGRTNWAKRHGYIRGWTKTDADGNYTFYTLRPGVYPNRSVPAHVHLTILEPNGKYYWIKSYHFEGDPLLTKDDLSDKSPRGGSNGVLSFKKEGALWVGSRDFILGKNIPNYD